MCSAGGVFEAANGEAPVVAMGKVDGQSVDELALARAGDPGDDREFAWPNCHVFIKRFPAGREPARTTIAIEQQRLVDVVDNIVQPGYRVGFGVIDTLAQYVDAVGQQYVIGILAMHVAAVGPAHPPATFLAETAREFFC